MARASFFRPLWVVVALAAFTQLHCAGCGAGPAREFDPPEPIEGPAEVSPRPQLAISVNGGDNLELAPGWPWVIEANILHPAAFGGSSSSPFELTGPQGTAESALSLELRNEAGDLVTLAFERLGTSLDTPVTLDATATVQGRWRAAGTNTASLAAGVYSLSLKLQTASLTVFSPPARVRLVATPDAGTFAAELARTDDALARGAWSEAETEADSVLATTPNHIRALTRKGDAREQQGDLEGAFHAFDRALKEAERQERGGLEGGPRHLRHRRERLLPLVDGGTY